MDTKSIISYIETNVGFEKILNTCKELRIKKHTDYGDSWKILRARSITDQIYIKAKRVRSIQEAKSAKVKDGIEGEFIAMINYSLMALYNLKNESNKITESNNEIVFEVIISDILELLENKNHDYGEVWRTIRISSMVDFILMKLLRLRQIEDNNYCVAHSEEATSSYKDIFNYAVFCLIRMEEGTPAY